MNTHQGPSTDLFSGLDLLLASIVVTDETGIVRYINAAAENLFQVSARNVWGESLSRVFGSTTALQKAIDAATNNNWAYTASDIHLLIHNDTEIRIDCMVVGIDRNPGWLLFDCRPIDNQIKVAREEVLLQSQQAGRELMRNLAHEIKNPLGGIRGSAQLLAAELQDPALREYTDVIIAEADRLQDLMNRLLTSHKRIRLERLNIHDALERVAKLIRAEYKAIQIIRDYDTSLPDIHGDSEHLIQAILNIVRNAAQAIDEQAVSEIEGKIILRTRVARQATFAKKRHRLALELQVIDNGPGIPEDLQAILFFPLVSGRESGSGLGLSIAQNFIEQHNGTIELSSVPGKTVFTLLLPCIMSDTTNRS